MAHTNHKGFSFSNQTLGLILALLVITVLLLVIAVSSNTVSNPIFIPNATTQPSPTPVARTTLSFSPSSLPVSSQSATFDVLINTGTNMVTGVQLELSFDPKMVSLVTLAQGTFFTNPVVLIKDVNYKTGRISFALGLPPGSQGQSGTGVIATVHVTTRLAQGGETQLQFLPKSLVTAKGAGQSMLKATTNGTLFYSTQPTALPTYSSGAMKY